MGWVVFMKDTRIRYNPAERAAVNQHMVRCFCLSSRSLSGAAMASRFLDNLPAIRTSAASLGRSSTPSTSTESNASPSGSRSRVSAFRAHP